MLKAIALTGLAVVLPGCAARAPAWTGEVKWPDEHSARPVGQPMEAGAALAAAGAIQELVKTNPFPDLFQGCASPEQGLDVAVFTGPTPGLYYVVVHQRFNRCGGPAIRVLDGWYSYAVTPQGEVVAEAPLPAGEDGSESPTLSPPETGTHPTEPPAVPAEPPPMPDTPPPAAPPTPAAPPAPEPGP